MNKNKLIIIVFFLIGITGNSVAQKGKITKENFRIALSVSPFTEMAFRNGIIYSDGVTTAMTAEGLQRLYKNHGANEVYARISTSRFPSKIGKDRSLNRGLERASLAKALNLPFNPEIGLFRIYGDVTHQPSPDFSDYPEIKIPGKWTSLTIEQMIPILKTYGAIVAKEILKTGVKVRIWNLGNEVQYGFAGIALRPDKKNAGVGNEGPDWYVAPDAVDPAIGKMTRQELKRMTETERIEWLKNHLWVHNAKVFIAVAEGIRSVDTDARFSTHISNSNPPIAMAFYKTMNENGFLPDELGFSFYPSNHTNTSDRLQKFMKNVAAINKELNRPVFIAEFGYPTEVMTSGFKWNTEQIGYPLSPEGQAGFIRDLVSWGVKENILSGIRPWAPDFFSGWAPMSLFFIENNRATPKPGLDAIVEGLNLGSQ